MFIRPKLAGTSKRIIILTAYQFKSKICKGSLEIMQITNFSADLCCILAVFKYKYLKIAAT